ncbi:MAG: glycosyltransferase family 4 protein [Candidatus Krumholzibacteriota bacterium]|nr:glycosyltransferase family 4 protein [Candidatus Krumholzibacteriota bacterium]
MINVCFVSDAPFFGGAERYITHVATGLDRSAFRPALVMRSDGADDRALETWRREMEANGIPVQRVPMRVPLRPDDVPGIRRAIAESRPDVVHVNMPGPYDGQMGLVAPIARLAGAKRVVTTEHLPMVEYLWKRALVKRVGYAFVDRVLTVCRANVPYLTGRQAVAKERVRVIPNALREDYGQSHTDPEAIRTEKDIPADRVVVTFVGNLLEHKGLADVILSLVEQPDMPWHLLVVGGGPEEERCRKLLADAGLESRATFVGAVPASEVESLLAASDILTLPSRIEGMPYVILEAMASSLPVVATSVYGIPEMVSDGDTGLLVAAGDRAALGQSLMRLIEDAELRRTLGTRARERFVQLFTLERQIASMEALYREVLAA